ncbi:MAG: hypothetical protein BGO97_11055 [Micrococcales bacterium 70-64]|nr:hypothetical protein [Leifsonia sp.]ODU64516.1 MAG: hypothetical protein ABT06_11060 [Leifsonia sp. SCN 70-46]OJX86208.1 MAG: hypothetical protein BGO97_11055 [Micrococcales bacterium 70-64]
MAQVEDDDAALSWAGDESRRAPEPAPRVELVETAATPARAQIPAALLVTYGILAGAYLIYTLGWVVSVQRYNTANLTSTEPLNAFMFGLGELLAIASPLLWFVSGLLLTRGRKPFVTLVALVVGLVVVLPWPFVLGVWQ